MEEKTSKISSSSADRASSPFYKSSQGKIASMFSSLPAEGSALERFINKHNNQTTLTGKLNDGTTWTYIGGVCNGQLHGKGKITWSSGDVYEGDWVDGKRTGKGKMIYASGAVYEGDWVDDKQTGKGKMTYSNGNVYEGDFVDGKQADKEKILSAAGSADNVSLEDGKFDLDKLRRISQESQQKGQIELEKKVLQYCDPKKIAQDLVKNLQTAAVDSAKRGGHGAKDAYFVWKKDYHFPVNNIIGPFGDISERIELAKTLFDLIKINISDNNIKLKVEERYDKDFNFFRIDADLSW